MTEKELAEKLRKQYTDNPPVFLLPTAGGYFFFFAADTGAISY